MKRPVGERYLVAASPAFEIRCAIPKDLAVFVFHEEVSISLARAARMLIWHTLSRMTCPSCKLENPPSAVRCDCGYVFAASVSPRERSLQSLPVDDPPLVVYLRSIDDSLRTIKR